MTRRTALGLFFAGFQARSAAPKWRSEWLSKIPAFLETHRRAEGAYGWSSDVIAHVTPTWGAVSSYRLLGLDVPDASRVADFVRKTYPVPEGRRKDRPLWRLDREQVETLLLLGESIESFRPLASTWVKPAEFTTRYELGANPVLQHQAAAVQIRSLLKLEATDDWKSYFEARRRGNGTFNNTPASDGSDGHIMNTLWGLMGCHALGIKVEGNASLLEWVRNCQLPSGGFSYAPEGSIGRTDDLAYTVCALSILKRLGAEPKDPAKCAAWIESLYLAEGGFQDRPGGEPNPVATRYALDAFRLLEREPATSVRAAPRASRKPIPEGARVFSVQIEAPGAGSPTEAVLMARALGIHIWTAKNSAAGWIAEAQRIANEQRVPVTFAIGNEEYGTYVDVPGLGCYSHLVDTVAPSGTDTGEQLPKKNHPYPWPEFRDTRLAALRRGGGRLVWQFLENEELTRVLLDEAVERGTYSAIASFHFGNENFLHSQPYLHRWYQRIPFVALQDAHGKESWWWGNQLAGFTTLFLAKEPTWEAWLQALENRHVLSVRHDAITGWKTHLAGGSPEVRAFVKQHEPEWRWWDDNGRQARRPAAALTVLRPSSKFEVGAPTSGVALRVRLWSENNGQALPQQARAELMDLVVDGNVVPTELYQAKDDRYHIARLEDTPGAHKAVARIRLLESGREVTVERSF